MNWYSGLWSGWTKIHSCTKNYFQVPVVEQNKDLFPSWVGRGPVLIVAQRPKLTDTSSLQLHHLEHMVSRLLASGEEHMGDGILARMCCDPLATVSHMAAPDRENLL